MAATSTTCSAWPPAGWAGRLKLHGERPSRRS
nr:MAG TPA_asm: hypothetical protein [Caudoviricetes sp.]